MNMDFFNEEKNFLPEISLCISFLKVLTWFWWLLDEIYPE